MKKILIILFATCMFSYASERIVTISSGFGYPETDLVQLIIEEGFKRAEIPLKYETLPNQRSLLNANNGISDGDAARIWELNTIYPNLIRVPVPIHNIDLVTLTKQNLYIKNYKDLKHFHVGVIRGMKIAEKIAINAKALSLTYATDHPVLMKMLFNNRLDAVITNKIALLGNLNEMKGKGFYIQSKPLVSRPLYLHLHKKNKKLIPKLEKAFQSMLDDGTVEKLHDSFYEDLTHQISEVLTIIQND